MGWRQIGHPQIARKYLNMRFIAIIPARAGSKRIPQKNIKPLLGKPLLVYSIEKALTAKHINEIVVSTDDVKVADIARKYNVEIIHRPLSLALDTTPTEDVLLHTIEEIQSRGKTATHFVLLQPTSPLRHPQDIDQAIEKLKTENADSLFSACKNTTFI